MVQFHFACMTCTCTRACAPTNAAAAAAATNHRCSLTSPGLDEAVLSSPPMPRSHPDTSLRPALMKPGSASLASPGLDEAGLSQTPLPRSDPDTSLRPALMRPGSAWFSFTLHARAARAHACAPTHAAATAAATIHPMQPYVAPSCSGCSYESPLQPYVARP